MVLLYLAFGLLFFGLFSPCPSLLPFPFFNPSLPVLFGFSLIPSTSIPGVGYSLRLLLFFDIFFYTFGFCIGG